MAFHFGIARSVSVRCAVLVGLLSCLAPLAAKANTCVYSSTTTCINNSDGNASSSSSGGSITLSLGGSKIGAINDDSNSGLGFLNFKTGSMMSGGSLAYGAIFSAGGSFTITNGTYGSVSNGTLFVGSFSGPVNWLLTSGTNCTICTYTLQGTVQGTWYVNGTTVTSGSTVQLDFTSNGLYAAGKSLTDVGGVTYLNVPPVPEPANVGLMGSGLLCMGLFVRHRIRGVLGTKNNQA